MISHLRLYADWMFGPSELTRAEREMLAVAVSSTNGSPANQFGTFRAPGSARRSLTLGAEGGRGARQGGPTSCACSTRR